MNLGFYGIKNTRQMNSVNKFYKIYPTNELTFYKNKKKYPTNELRFTNRGAPPIFLIPPIYKKCLIIMEADWDKNKTI